MSTIAQVKEIIQRVLGPRADELARETHFVRRKRNLDGSDFVQGLVFGYLHQADATTEDLAQILGRREVDISASGLCQRFTPAAAEFLKQVMQELIKEGVQAEQPVPAELVGRFEAVIVEDSSTIKLPDKLKDVWPGCGGGQGQSKAGLKLHVRWDLKQGGLQGPLLTASRQADQRSPLRQEGIAAGVLNITDESYCSLDWLKEQEGFFLTRPQSRVWFLDRHSGQPLDLEQIGPKVSNGSLQLEVLVGKQARLPARLILVRVPEEVIEQRRKRIREDAKRRGKEASPQALSRAQWTILITNVPADTLTISEVLVLQRARWQIERLFRLWKDGGKIDEWQGRTSWRILCEIYAKVMAMLIQHWLLVLGTWHDPYRSLVKAAKLVRQHALELLSALAGESSWQRVTTRLLRAMQACRLHRRLKHPSHPQLLLEGLDWCLT
jgi:Transposase DDE domain